DRGGDVRVTAEVARGVDGAHLVAVAGARGETGITEVRGGGRGDLRERGAAGALAALDAVAGDAHVVGRGRPPQIDLRCARRGRGQPRRYGGRREIGGGRDRRGG